MFILKKMATEEIEQQVNHVYRSAAPESLRITQNLVDLDLQAEQLSGITIINNRMQTFGSEFFFTYERDKPVLMLFFQIKNTSNFTQGGTIVVPEMHHSVNYLPVTQSSSRAEKHTFSHNLCIKIDPALITGKWLHECSSNESWARMLTSEDAYVTMDASRPMGKEVLDALQQLTNCPYKGEMGNFYKESIVRLLFVHQMAEFVQMPGAGLTGPQKLTRKDVDVLHDVKNYLEMNYLDDLSLDGIIRQFGLNAFKLKYGFKALFNTSVMRFIDDKKMSYARQILCDQHDLDMYDIADRLGYSHYSNFSLAFKRRFGYAPTQVRHHFTSPGMIPFS
nr:AraC family transcriptional regulator [uncultured Dyadobacter sp.]